MSRETENVLLLLVGMATGIITGKKPFLKSLITSCFIDSDLAIYMMSAMDAISEV